MKRSTYILLSLSLFLTCALCLAPSALCQLPPAKPIKVKVAVVIQDPVLPQYGGKRLHEVAKTPGRNFQWNDPWELSREYEAALEKISHGVLRIEVVKIIDDGQLFSRRNDNNDMLSTDEMMKLLMEPDWKTLKETGTHFDYKAFIEHYGFDKMRDRDQINEVWVWSFPYGGMWESNYCGSTGFWLNSEPTTTTSNKKLLVVMGLNYERKMSLALESYGHRFESVMWHLYSRWNYEASDPNNWEIYTRFNKTHPGLANIGNIHFPSNGEHDYDWINKTPVTTCADGWNYYPDIKSDMTRTVDCTEWQCSHEGYMTWWFSHIPHFAGINPSDGHLNNWWHYVVNWEEAIRKETADRRPPTKETRQPTADRRPPEGKGEQGHTPSTVSEANVGNQGVRRIPALCISTGNDPEQKAAYDFLTQLSDQPQHPQLTANQLGKEISKYKPRLIWYHEPDSTMDFEAEAAKMSRTLKKFVEQGGRLLLTLDAIKLLPYLGVESKPPTATYVNLIDEGNGRKLGLHSFRSHPVFDGMLGGAYVYAPKEDVLVRRVGWFGNTVPDGRVIGVDWAYIFLHENSKLITEYTLGKGKILAVGAYLYFNQDNYNRAHLEKFADNVLVYLAGEKSATPARYWDFTADGGTAQTVVEIHDAGTDNVETHDVETHDHASLRSGRPVIWTQAASEIVLRSSAAPKNMWDIAGERLVLMGKEPGGIDEVWSHPVMALRDYGVTVKSGNKTDPIDLNSLKPEIEVRPESFTRIYPIPTGQLKEIVTVHPTDGNAVIHYEYTGNQSIEIKISLKSNLRLMWPYSEQVTGEIRYGWDKGLNAWVIRDKSGDFATVIGLNIPVSSKSGNPDGDLKVALGMSATLESNAGADVVIGTSATGVTEAVSAYRRALMNPAAVHEAAVKNAGSLFKGKLSIIGPDQDFNTGYRWAMVGTDRFIVNTPGIGRSLVAGYATTDFGWNGAQKVNGRPGYAWYFGRDAVWSSFAVLDYGDFDRVRTVLELFSKYQDISGKIYHELTTSGIAHFDAADATPLYIALAGKYLHHSGDTAFIRKEWPAIKKAIDFCFSTDTDGDHLIENTQQGHGWEEGGDLYGTHTTLYMVSCWAEALNQAAYMAKYLGLDALGKQYSDEAGIVLEKLNIGFWNPETKFFNHGIYKDGTYLSEPSVMTAIPVYWGQIADQRRSASVTEQIASCNFTTDWGTRIVSEKAKFFAPGGYHTGSVWPLFTGWASLGDYATGHPAQGFSKMMSNLLIYKNWSLGYIEEVLHGTQYKYFGVCRHQCWSETMVLQPAIEGMLGLRPDAMANTMNLSLNFPFDWDSVKVENIRMNSFNLSIQFLRNADQTQIRLNPLTSLHPSPPLIHLNIPFPAGTMILDVRVDGQACEYRKNRDGISLELKPDGPEIIEIKHKGGISVLPQVHHPAPGDSSTGLKIISDKPAGNLYKVLVEGLSGTRGEIRLIESGRIIEHPFSFPESGEKYARTELVFRNPEPVNEVFYYVLTRSYFDSNGDETGDLNGLRQKLDYLKDLGVTSILTLPLCESDFYHNYFATDYKKIDPEYGNMDDLVSLIREVHRKGMKFYLDMETQYITEGSGWYSNNPDYQLKGTPWGRLLSYTGESRGMNMANLNHPEVKKYFLDLYKLFLDPNDDGEFDDGVDGFRIDHIMDDLDNQGRLTNLYAGFWKPLFDELKKINPDVRIIGEQADWGSYGEEIFREADLDYLFGFRIAMTMENLNKKRLISEIENTIRAAPEGKDQLIFIENHDLDRFASRVSGNLQKEKVGAAFNVLLKGVPLIYYGQELGMQGVKYNGNSDGNDIPRREAFEWYRKADGQGMAFWYRNTGPWWTNSNVKSDDGISLEEQQSDPGSLWNFYRTLLTLRRKQMAIRSGTLEFITVDNPAILAFSRKFGEEEIHIVVNLSGREQSIRIRDRLEDIGRQVLLNEPDSNHFANNYLEIKPYGIIVLKHR